MRLGVPSVLTSSVQSRRVVALACIVREVSTISECGVGENGTLYLSRIDTGLPPPLRSATVDVGIYPSIKDGQTSVRWKPHVGLEA